LAHEAVSGHGTARMLQRRKLKVFCIVLLGFFHYSAILPLDSFLSYPLNLPRGIFPYLTLLLVLLMAIILEEE